MTDAFPLYLMGIVELVETDRALPIECGDLLFIYQIGQLEVSFDHVGIRHIRRGHLIVLVVAISFLKSEKNVEMFIVLRVKVIH